MFFAIAVTLYFWWLNIKEIPESSTKALRIMQVMTVMVVMFLLLRTVTLIEKGPAQIPPAPTASNLPKLKNLKITGNIICVYAAMSTGARSPVDLCQRGAAYESDIGYIQGIATSPRTWNFGDRRHYLEIAPELKWISYVHNFEVMAPVTEIRFI